MTKQDFIERIDDIVRQYQHSNRDMSYRKAVLSLLEAKSSDDDRELSEIVTFFAKAKSEREAYERRRRG